MTPLEKQLLAALGDKAGLVERMSLYFGPDHKPILRATYTIAPAITGEDSRVNHRFFELREITEEEQVDDRT